MDASAASRPPDWFSWHAYGVPTGPLAVFLHCRFLGGPHIDIALYTVPTINSMPSQTLAKTELMSGPVGQQPVGSWVYRAAASAASSTAVRWRAAFKRRLAPCVAGRRRPPQRY